MCTLETLSRTEKIYKNFNMHKIVLKHLSWDIWVADMIWIYFVLLNEKVKLMPKIGQAQLRFQHFSLAVYVLQAKEAELLVINKILEDSELTPQNFREWKHGNEELLQDIEKGEKAIAMPSTETVSRSDDGARGLNFSDGEQLVDAEISDDGGSNPKDATVFLQTHSTDMDNTIPMENYFYIWNTGIKSPKITIYRDWQDPLREKKIIHALKFIPPGTEQMFFDRSEYHLGILKLLYMYYKVSRNLWYNAFTWIRNKSNLGTC